MLAQRMMMGASGAAEAGPPPVGNGLLNSLVGYWPGNEASGDLLDAHTGGLTLGDVNTVTNSAGKVYATARQYTQANGESHARAQGTASTVGGTDKSFTVMAWVYADSFPSTATIMSRWRTDSEATVKEFLLRYSSSRFNLYVSNDGSTTRGPVTADTFGAPSTGTWYMVLAWHDAAADTLNISVNNGVADSIAYSLGIGVRTCSLRVARQSSTTENWDGRIGPTALWLATLTSEQRTALYNGGNGLPYTSFES